MLKFISSYFSNSAETSNKISLPNDVLSEIVKFIPDKITLAHFALANKDCSNICRISINSDLKSYCPDPICDSYLIEKLWNRICQEQRRKEVKLTFVPTLSDNSTSPKFQTIMRDLLTCCPGYEYNLIQNGEIKFVSYTKIGTGEELFQLIKIKPPISNKITQEQIIGHWSRLNLLMVQKGIKPKSIGIYIQSEHGKANLTMIEKVHTRLISIMSEQHRLERTAENLQQIHLLLTGWSGRAIRLVKGFGYILPKSMIRSPPKTIYGPTLTLNRCLKYWDTLGQ